MGDVWDSENVRNNRYRGTIGIVCDIRRGIWGKMSIGNYCGILGILENLKLFEIRK